MDSYILQLTENLLITPGDFCAGSPSSSRIKLMLAYTQFKREDFGKSVAFSDFLDLAAKAVAAPVREFLFVVLAPGTPKPLAFRTENKSEKDGNLPALEGETDQKSFGYLRRKAQDAEKAHKMFRNAFVQVGIEYDRKKVAVDAGSKDSENLTLFFLQLKEANVVNRTLYSQAIAHGKLAVVENFKLGMPGFEAVAEMEPVMKTFLAQQTDTETKRAHKEVEKKEETVEGPRKEAGEAREGRAERARAPENKEMNMVLKRFFKLQEKEKEKEKEMTSSTETSPPPNKVFVEDFTSKLDSIVSAFDWASL